MSQMMHAVASQSDMQVTPLPGALCNSTHAAGKSLTATGGAKAALCRLASMSQMVQVVSMLEVPRRLGSVSFQSKEVRGAQYSEFLFCNAAHRTWGIGRLI